MEAHALTLVQSRDALTLRVGTHVRTLCVTDRHHPSLALQAGASATQSIAPMAFPRGAWERGHTTYHLQGNIAVLAPRILQLLVAQHRQGAADAFAGFVGQDDVVDEAAMAGDEGIGEFLLVLLLAGGDLCRVAFLV